jgi:hypothetical protein
MLRAIRKRITPPAVIITSELAVVWVKMARQRAFRRTPVGAVLPVASVLLAAAMLASPAQAESCPNEALRVGPSANLPDCRAYEQATPNDKNGANAGGDINFVQASADGNRVTYSNAAGQPSDGGSSSPPVYFASRGSDAWSSNNLLPLVRPGRRAEILGWDGEITRAASVAREEGLFLADAAAGTFQLVPSVPARIGERPILAGFAADPDHLVFDERGSTGYVEGAVPEHENAYDLDHGVLTLVGRIPAGAATTCDDAVAGEECVPAPEGSFAGPYAWYQANTAQGHPESDFYYTQNAISADGSKAFFTAAGTGQLYMREDGTRTVQISASQRTKGADPNGPRPAAFVGATPDGSRVFFLSCEKLTDDSTAVSTAEETCVSEEPSQGQDLYSYDTGSGVLTDLTVDSNASEPQRAGVFGFLGASEDGSDAYFVANGVLDGSQPNKKGEVPTQGNCLIVPGNPAFTTGSCNLYLSRGGTPIFIARLDAATTDVYNWIPDFSRQSGERVRESRVAANGTLLFTTTASLTGYENTSTTSVGTCEDRSASRCSELYRYAPTGGELTCVSCDPTGAPPNGYARLQSRQSVNGIEGKPFTAMLTRNITPDGDRVFFDSPDALVAADTNGVMDPYEWEAPDSTNPTDSCTSESPAFVPSSGGCLFLLSSGTSPQPSYLADISASGNDAFLFTDEPLVPSDNDELTDVYDARVGGGLPSQHPATAAEPCLGEACKGASASAPSESTAGSATFSGLGNLPPAAPATVVKPKPLTRAQKLTKALKACRTKHDRHKRVACESQARKRYGPPKSKQAKKFHSGSHKGGK